jgi:hypothetical protein
MNWVRFAVTGGAWLASACCQRHVQLKFPDASPNGDDYVCSVTTSAEEKCTPSKVNNPADDNRANTVFVILPRECLKNFNQITIHDSGSATPTVNVKCAPPEGKIQ